MTVVCRKFGLDKLLKHAMVLKTPYPIILGRKVYAMRAMAGICGLYQVGEASQAMRLTNSMYRSVLYPPPFTIEIFTDSSGLRS